MGGDIFSITLAKDIAEFQLDGELVRLPCTIVIETRSRPVLRFRLEGNVPNLSAGGSLSVRLVEAGVRFEAFVTKFDFEGLTLTSQREPISTGSFAHLATVDFDLINFPSFRVGPPAPKPADHLDIEGRCWRIELRPRRISTEIDAFRSEQYGITHSCSMRRIDHSTFSSVAAHDAIDALHDTLSFAAGRWVAPVLVRGRDSDGKITWEEWGTRRLHPNLARIETWFDVHHASCLNEIFPAILNLKEEATRFETFHSALYWYVRSTGNAAGQDGGIILLQAALELLSWQTLVRDRKALSEGGFGKLPADDQIRLLIEGAQIPTDIPPGLNDLRSKAKELSWPDGPKALTSTRNQLVHPTKNKKELPYYDSWRLAEWYVELLLLKMLRYNGVYSNRTGAQRWVGNVERMPWAGE